MVPVVLSGGAPITVADMVTVGLANDGSSSATDTISI